MKTIFESNRILFNEVSLELIDDYLKMVNDHEKVNKYFCFNREYFTKADETTWVQTAIKEKKLVFSMVDKQTKSFIGNIELMHPEKKEAELGIAITGKMQDLGFGTEAITTLLEYGFTKLGFTRIYLRTHPQNARAIHVYLKCGFTEYNRTSDTVFMEKYAN